MNSSLRAAGVGLM